MKLNHVLIAAAAAVAPMLAFGVAPKASPATSDRVEVQFLEPTKFTDVRGSLNDESDRNGYLDQLRTHINTIAPEYVSDGQKLQITFTDVDLAGDFPPGRSPNADTIRVMKPIYPPRMAFSYRLTDASGAVVKEGKADLTDPNYMTTAALTDRNDPLRYDKVLVSDWFRKEFGRK
jgi:hypothetical protein